MATASIEMFVLMGSNVTQTGQDWHRHNAAAAPKARCSHHHHHQQQQLGRDATDVNMIFG